MKQNEAVLPLAVLLAALSLVCPARAQHPTAVQALELSAFGGVSGVFTGLSGGKNLSFTAGADLAFPPLFHMRPTAEIRGTYPMARGTITSQESVLGGLRLDFPLGHRWHPYGNFLAGRGQMNYGDGYAYNNYLYDLTTTNVFSYGGGVDLDIAEHWAFKADGQIQHWGTTPTPSGSIYSKVGTAGVIYRFDFNRRGHR
jgi:Outer membrane protein beta-barrel domain